MPSRKWRHTCCAQARGSTTHAETCPDCGNPGKYIGWHYAMAELKEIYEAVYGLKAVGPHRPFADRVFAACSARCFYCAGTGLLDDPADVSYVPCPMCKGNGYYLNLDPAELEARRERVLARYPDARPGSPGHQREDVALVEEFIRGLAWDTSTGEPPAGN